MRLHRGAPANVSSSDLTGRQEVSRISASQVSCSPWPSCASPLRPRARSWRESRLGPLFSPLRYPWSSPFSLAASWLPFILRELAWPPLAKVETEALSGSSLHYPGPA